MKNSRRRSGLVMGHDSFLDIVANLVGILIILVVVLGSRTQEVAEAIRSGTPTPAAANAVTEESLEEGLRTLERESARAASALADSQRLEAAVRQGDMQLALAQQRRGELMDLLEQARAAWEEKQRELKQEDVERGKAEAKVAAARTELEDLQRTRARVEQDDRPVVAVSHLPTPMAKTVFGKELHFRLRGGRLAVVPIERLGEEIERDVYRAAIGSREGRIDAAVGPIAGFVARYEVEKSRETINRAGRISTGPRIQLVRIVVEPLSEPYGEPIERVLNQSGNMLDIELAGRSPDRTTVTVWVYSDSFAEFRRLKEYLYARGYATAARPLSMNDPIAGSPQGSRSISQ